MSDYLSNLAARTLRQTDVIQPRLASLFEPLPVTGGLLAGRLPAHLETASDEQLADDTTFAASLMTAAPFGTPLQAPASMPGIQPPPDIQPRQQQRLGTGAAQSMAEHSGPSASRQPPPLIAPPPIDVRAELLPRPAMPTPAQTIFIQTPAPIGPPEAGWPAPAPTLPRPSPEPPGLGPDTAAPQADAALSGETATPENHTVLAPHMQRHPEEQGGLHAAPLVQDTGYLEVVSHRARGPSPPATVVAQQHEIPLLEPAVPAPTAPITLQEPIPTIKITIGRVDVRAIMPASPAPRPSPARPSPSLSLEDYLKQRAGRRQ